MTIYTVYFTPSCIPQTVQLSVYKASVDTEMWTVFLKKSEKNEFIFIYSRNIAQSAAICSAVTRAENPAEISRIIKQKIAAFLGSSG
jgi:hypothetical protein